MTDPTLSSGAHKDIQSGACLLELTSHLAGEQWSDTPVCVSAALATFGRGLNDAILPERQDLEPHLRALAPMLIGTAGDLHADQRAGLLAVDWLCRTSTPAWLRLAGLTAEAKALEQSPPVVAWELFPIHAMYDAFTAACNAAPSFVDDTRSIQCAETARFSAIDTVHDTTAQDAARFAALDTVRDVGPAPFRAVGQACDTGLYAAYAAALAGAPLAPTVAILQDSALELFGRMIAEFGKGEK